MDLASLKEQSSEPIDVPLIFNEDGVPTDGFKVVGVNSKQYQDADRAWRLLNVRRAAQQQNRNVSPATEEGAADIIERVDRREEAIALACVVEIYGFTVDGKPAPLTSDVLKTIFKARPHWRSKVVAAIEAEQTFTKASSVPGAET